MKFGKRMRLQIDETLPDWRGHFIPYKELKKLLKTIPTRDMLSNENSADDQVENKPTLDELIKLGTVRNPADETMRRTVRLLSSKRGVDFLTRVNEEILKVINFFCDKEEDFIIKVQRLADMVKARDEAAFKTDEPSEEVDYIRHELAGVQGEMALLVHYSILNMIALGKLMKKHDKHTGTFVAYTYAEDLAKLPFTNIKPLMERLKQACTLFAFANNQSNDLDKKPEDGKNEQADSSQDKEKRKNEGDMSASMNNKATGSTPTEQEPDNPYMPRKRLKFTLKTDFDVGYMDGQAVSQEVEKATLGTIKELRQFQEYRRSRYPSKAEPDGLGFFPVYEDISDGSDSDDTENAAASDGPSRKTN